ncbi:4-hydroxythreonine-4-phosphate dehydrogenase PdxA [Isoalcanivorax beigongshangi]|uniref:4-hydroxythreonine-4-phosphate dehydrogenase n=1 Tax=Isoalcanivorax beigongshangi TaxID=3238810 RepID=A0ABV4AEE8_9GAMM
MPLPRVSDRRPLAVTSGDPAGIGPDLVLGLPRSQPGAPLVVLGDLDVLQARAEQLRLEVRLRAWQPGDRASGEALSVWHCPAGANVIAGQPDPATARGTLTLLDRAIDGCLDGTFAGMVTAPLSKAVICEGADASFTGHTEYLAQRSGIERVVMMLATPALRVALATTHLPLREVADAINADDLSATLRILHKDLRERFSVPHPRIMVLGLNPHAGESGHLGREELDVIIPVLDALRAEGMQLSGPLPADTAFTPKHLAQQDAVLAMYHDQGLPVLKYSGFGEAINITLGLPFVRTSVDHGTAFDLAGSGRASHRSLQAATRWAMTLAGQ